MEPLRTSKRVFTLICVHPTSSNTKPWLKIFYILFTVTTNILIVSAIFSNAAFIVKFMSTNMKHSVIATFQCFGSLGILNMTLCGLVLRHHIVDSLDRLKRIYDECKISFDDELFVNL